MVVGSRGQTAGKGVAREMSGAAVMLEAVQEEKEEVGGRDGEACRGNGILTTRSTSRTHR